MRALYTKTAAVWAAAGAVATALLLPYMLAMMPKLGDTMMHGRLPFPLLVALQCLQAGVVLFVATWIGLRAGTGAELQSPLVGAWLGGPRVPAGTVRSLAIAAGAGIATGLVVLAIQKLTAPYLPPMRIDAPSIARWKGFFASFYGGIVEELQFRCFIMGVGTRILMAFGVSARSALAIAIPVAAVAFGGGHLPAAASVWGLTPMVVFVTVTLNTLVGLVAGSLYARRGLEHAVIAHFSVDLVLHVAGGS